MSREVKLPAVPSSPRQHARRRRILAAATELSSAADTVVMQDVADHAGVAIATLYRYFPSKAQLFLGVAADQMERLQREFVPPPDGGPDAAIHALLMRATRYLVAHPTLATAIIEAQGSASAEIVTETDLVQERLHTTLLAVAGQDVHDSWNRHLMRLVVQNWFGVLQTVLNGRLSFDQGDQDLALACRLLLAGLRDPDVAERIDLTSRSA